MCSSRCALAFTALLVLIASGGLPLGVEGGKYDHLFQLNYELPKFLAGAPDAVKAEHQAMWDNGVKTMTEKALIKVEAEWVAKQSPEIQVVWFCQFGLMVS
jgi:hypothetical protein